MCALWWKIMLQAMQAFNSLVWCACYQPTASVSLFRSLDKPSREDHRCARRVTSFDLLLQPLTPIVTFSSTQSSIGEPSRSLSYLTRDLCIEFFPAFQVTIFWDTQLFMIFLFEGRLPCQPIRISSKTTQPSDIPPAIYYIARAFQ